MNDLNNADQYQDWTAQVAVYPEAEFGTSRALNYAIMGLLGEAGELANKFKKLYRNGSITLDEREVLDPDIGDTILIDELGDVLWYATRVATELNFPLSLVLSRNIAKLEGRKAKNEIVNHERDE